MWKGFLVAAIIAVFLFDLTAFIFWNAEEREYRKLSRILFVASIPLTFVAIYSLVEILNAALF